jgi:hypothetical protein
MEDGLKVLSIKNGINQEPFGGSYQNLKLNLGYALCNLKFPNSSNECYFIRHWNVLN